MKKLLILFFLFVFPLCSFAKEFNFDSEKDKINTAIDNRKYTKAIKLINKINQNANLTDEQKTILSERKNYALKKYNEVKFWKKYIVENDEYLHATKYYPKDYNILPVVIVLYKNQKNKIDISMNFKITYFSGSFLNAKSVMFKNYDYELSKFKNQDFKVTSCTGIECRYYEYFFKDIAKSDLLKIKEIASQKNAEYRIYGQNYYRDFKLGMLEKDALLDMVDLYNYLTKK